MSTNYETHENPIQTPESIETSVAKDAINVVSSQIHESTNYQNSLIELILGFFDKGTTTEKVSRSWREMITSLLTAMISIILVSVGISTGGNTTVSGAPTPSIDLTFIILAGIIAGTIIISLLIITRKKGESLEAMIK